MRKDEAAKKAFELFIELIRAGRYTQSKDMDAITSELHALAESLKKLDTD